MENNYNKIELNGYLSIYMPNHPRAYKGCGCVYEHILIAEKMLGRPLKDNECVHHKDKNRKNNDPSNLMVFKTTADHNRYHCGYEVTLLEDGTYICKTNVIKDDKTKSRYRKVLCPICKTNYMYVKSQMCIECRKAKERQLPISKEELRELIFNYPFTKIGEMFKVTDNAVRKWCKRYGLPFRRKDIDFMKNTQQTSY